MNRKTVIGVGICLLLILSLLPLCGAGKVIRWNSAVLVNYTYSFQSDMPVTEEWFLDSQKIYEDISYDTNCNWTYFWTIEEVGYHNVTCVMTAENELSSSVEWRMYVGTKFAVPNGTSEVNTTTLPVITAPGETFNVTTTVSPAVTRPTFILHEVTSTATQLLQPTEGSYEYDFRFVNNSTAVSTFVANDKNGTFLIGIYNSAIAEDLEENIVPLNRIAAEVIVSPRYDIGGAGGKPDFVVNIIDLTILRQHYGEIIPVDVEPPRYDIDKNRIVNIIDLTILKQNYGKTIPTV